MKKTLFKYLTQAVMLTTGKNRPSRLKSLNKPFTGTPLSVNEIEGTVRSKAQPMISPFL